jgi:hypothetical protein
MTLSTEMRDSTQASSKKYEYSNYTQTIDPKSTVVDSINIDQLLKNSFPIIKDIRS